GKVFANRAQHDHAHALVLVQSLEYQSHLIALRHLDHIERRTIEDDVGALLLGVHFHLEAVERGEARIGKCHRGHAAVPSWCELLAFSDSYSPATSLRRNSLPTGDLGMSLTKM